MKKKNFVLFLLLISEMIFIREISVKGFIASRNSCLVTKNEYAIKYEDVNVNVPVDLLQNKSDYTSSNGCIPSLPPMDTITFSNIFWQELKLENGGSAYLYSAYYDHRNMVHTDIRINTIVSKRDIPLVKYCQIWFPKEKKVVISNISSAIQMNPREWSTMQYLISCEIPSEFQGVVPAAVSVVQSKCDIATNVLTVIYNPLQVWEKKQDFAICIKALSFPDVDLSFHFIQYIELAKILGIHKIFMYQFSMHPNISSTLRYYERQGIVMMTPFTFPGTYPNLPAVVRPLFNDNKIPLFFEMMINMERATHNDCFYRNMYKYRYIAFFDSDEIMIPSNGKSWKQAIEDVINREKVKQGILYKPPNAYRIPMGQFKSSFRTNVNPSIPPYMSMLQNVNRTGMIIRYKQLIDTASNMGISNHEQTQCIGKCKFHNLEESDLFLNHYRDGKCEIPGMSAREIAGCNELVLDTRILHYKDDMIKHVNKALKYIGLL